MGKYAVDIVGIDTNKLKVLKQNEMCILFKKFKEGDKLAKEELINGNLKLVLSIIKNFNNGKTDMNDLFQVGCIGLVKAVDNFDLDVGVMFSTYAVPLILGEVKRYLRDSNTIRVTRSIRDRAILIMKFKDKFFEENGYEPDIDVICKSLDISEYELREAYDSLIQPMSIYDPIYNDGGDTIYLLDQLENKKDNLNKDELISLRKALTKIKERERRVLVDRYIIGKTQTELASEYGVSQAQISRIEKKALSEESISKMTIPASLEKADDIFKYLSFNAIFDEIIIDANNKLFKKKDLMIVSIDEKVLYREFVDSAIFMVPEYIEKLNYNSVLASSVIIHENVYVIQNNFLNFSNYLYSKIFLLDEVKAGYHERWDEDVNKVYTGDSFTLYNGIIYAVEKNKVSAVSYYDIENPLTIADTVRINKVSYDVTGIDNYAFVNAKFNTDIYISNKITTIGTNAFHEIVNAEGKAYFNVFIPSNVEKIKFGGFYVSDKTLNIYCEAPTKPQNWDYQCFRVSQSHGTGIKLNVYYNESGIPKEE
mgnify:CR=1 FL=1